jgi:uncharacterized protein
MPTKPSEKEDEYFARLEFEKKKKIEAEAQGKLSAGAREEARALHHMKCPKCGMGLVEVDYKGIRIDRCSGCSGVWLDPGELDAVSNLEKSKLDKFFSVFK